MDSIQKTARFAGFLYLLLMLTAPIGLVIVPAKLMVAENAAATAARIAAAPWLLRVGVASGLTSAVISIFLALALYRLLEGVHQRHAVLMVILVLVQVPLTFLNEVSSLGALLLARGANFLSALDKPQRDALAMLFLHLHGQGILVSQAFWGLWLLPFGALVYRSRFLPRFLGGWLIVNGTAYVALCIVSVLFPQVARPASRIAFPILFGEIAIMLWLLVVGARPQLRKAPAAVS